MLGDFIGRGLFMVLGFAYPAFECFKTVERNKVNIEELRFWCQYWIIIAVLSVCERFGDIFISWVPLYGELKLAFIIYLWYPQTKGTSYVYESLLRPFVSKHETDIDKNLQELRYRAWDVAIYYWQNCTELGSSAVFNVFDYIANQSSRLRGGSTQKDDRKRRDGRGSPPPQPPSKGSSIWPLRQRKSKPESPTASPLHPNHREEQPAPSAPPLPAPFPSLFKNEAQHSKSKLVQMKLEEAQTEYIYVQEVPEEAHSKGPEKEKTKLSPTRLKFRRS
ncbi:putative HVA22-like protein g [Chenopodium quinoa]|uniref:HVA22-like protein n=1 Tax=Chenopodium quinoa TaxID=63459 RepID=A0A803MXV7_CHEQI|nr:putative HVA22-like protein g [Chenopodium quinoa]